MRNPIKATPAVEATSNRRQQVSAMSQPTPATAKPQPVSSAVVDPLSREIKRYCCPNCPASNGSNHAQVGDGAREVDQTPAQRCCRKYLLGRSTEEKPHRAYRDANGLILMCMYCRRTRRANSTSEQWDWVEAYVLQMPSNVTHGICKSCMKTELANAGIHRRLADLSRKASQ